MAVNKVWILDPRNRVFVLENETTRYTQDQLKVLSQVGPKP